MGNVVDTFVDYCPDHIVRSVSDTLIRRREKRKKQSIDNEESELIESLHSPKRRKLTCTAHYIFQALFVEGKDSDITVNVLNKDWKLHKIYLGQSQYFNSMFFSGAWNEWKKSYVSIEVEDSNITEEALTAVFGSFYQDEVTVEPRIVVGVLAASTMFQLDGLIEQCYEIMLETISPVTVVKYYHASCTYGAQKVKLEVISWFLYNLTDYYLKNPSRLKEIDVELMNVILSKPELRVIQTEMSLYTLLKKWMYCRVNSTSDISESSKDPDIFFRGKENESYINTESGEIYAPVFKNLRLGHLFLHLKDLENILRDKIIPKDWAYPAYESLWHNLLCIVSGVDKGSLSVDEDYFNKNSIRCGREIKQNDNRSWRWSWFSYGVDLVWSIVDNTVLVRRQRTVLDHTLSDHPHNVLIKLEILTFDQKRQIKKHMKTDIMCISLTRSQETKLTTLESDLDFPIYIFVNVLFTSQSNNSRINSTA